MDAKSVAYLAEVNEDGDPSIGTKIFENLIFFVFEVDSQIHLTIKNLLTINILQISLTMI